MADLVVASLNPLLSHPFVDPDEATFGDVPTRKELELRVGNATKGAGSLIELRTSTAQIVEAERVGHVVEPATSHTTWTAWNGSTLSSPATNPAGYTGTSVSILSSNIPTGGATRLLATANAIVGRIPLSDYGGGALMRVWFRASSITNLTYQLRFQDAGGTWQVEWTVTPTTINVFEEKSIAKSALTVLTGTPNWATWDGLTRVQAKNTGGATVSPTVLVRDLRIGFPQAAEATIDVRARYGDVQAPGTMGAWSAWASVLLSSAPVLGSGTPTGTVTNPHPTLGYTFAGAAGRAQAYRQVQVYDVTGGISDLLYDTGLVATSSTAPAIPPGVLTQTGRTIQVVVVGVDSVGLAGTLTWTFATSFAAPAAITGLTITPNPELGAFDLAWDQSADATNFVQYIVEMRPDPWSAYERIDAGLLTSRTTPSTRAYVAPNATDVAFRVSQDNGFAWGPADDAQARTLIYDLQVVRPGDPEYTWTWPMVTAEPKRYDLAVDVLRPFGRGGNVASRGETAGASGTLTGIVPSEDAWQVDRWLALQGDPDPVLLKTRRGDVIPAIIGAVTVTPVPGDAQQVDVDYVQV